MALTDLTPDLQQTIRTVCTPKEIDVLERLSTGASQRDVARALNVSRQTVRDRLRNATRKIIAATEEAA